MKLYFSPGACSLSPHIVLRESGLPFELEAVDLKTKKTKSRADFNTISVKSAVPTLQLDDGQVLTEGAAIVQYLADKAPVMKLAPTAGTLERVRLQEWLNFIATELHKTFSPLFSPATPPETKKLAMDKLRKNFGYVERQLEGKAYLMGEHFTGAVAYLYVMLTWAGLFQMDRAQWPTLAAYFERVSARPAVKAALEAERQARAN